jgi:predicted phosphoribosyltransferase
MVARFHDRREAGRHLATALQSMAGEPGVLVLALPRGGVPVAYEVAIALGAPLDVFIVRKLGVPGHEELAMGAIAQGGVRVLNREVIEPLGIPDSVIDRVAAAEGAELDRRERIYRGGVSAPELRGHTVLLVDDGLATGATMAAAVAGVRAHGPSRIVVAVPVAAPETVEMMREVADGCVSVLTPPYFGGVGQWYEDFSQTSDDEVRSLLEAARHRVPVPGA